MNQSASAIFAQLFAPRCLTLGNFLARRSSSSVAYQAAKSNLLHAKKASRLFCYIIAHPQNLCPRGCVRACEREKGESMSSEATHTIGICRPPPEMSNTRSLRPPAPFVFRQRTGENWSRDLHLPFIAAALEIQYQL
jgi:hypothetical protein